MRFISIIPATREVEIGRIIVKGQPRQKVSEPLSQQVSWEWWVRICNSSYAGGVGRRITAQD
jgi:hypothetical protein